MHRAGQQQATLPVLGCPILGFWAWADGHNGKAGETMPETPRFVATVGMHSSASTWVFNVVRELMTAALGAENVVAAFADDVRELLAEQPLQGRHLVLKSHHGGAGWDSLVWLARPAVFVSIRDPRDGAISLAQRFRIPLADAARGIGVDCRRIERCADAGHPMLRYEDRFFEDPAMPGRLAEALGLTVDASVQQAIFERFSTAATRAFAANFSALPAERVMDNGKTVFDRVTQIHRTHIGDGRVGKWRDLLTPPNAAELTRYFAPFLARFGYPQ
jgi:hypothetical protein